VNARLLHRDVQEFLNENLDSDLDRVIFRGSPFPDISVQELAEQIQSRRKCRAKLPTWYKTPGIVYPPKVSIEQASSEEAARYKASLVSGKSLADLSGGFGVDAYFFSQRLDQVLYCELNEKLMQIAEHNFQVLGANNIRCLSADSMKHLQGSGESYDWVYLDPARRNEARDRVFLLEDCSPNIVENLDLLLSRANRVLLKLSPLLDISRAAEQLGCAEEIHVLALDNEVKELLFLLNKEPTAPARIHAVNLKGDVSESFISDLEDNDAVIHYGPALGFLYEPNAAILKAGLFKQVAREFNLTKLHPNSHLYSSDALISFPGRRFAVEKQMRYSPKKVRKELRSNRAHVTTRNFHESVASIRKRTGLKDGGDHYLFFTTDHEGRSLVLFCTKAD
jgi:hypothetical protein